MSLRRALLVATLSLAPSLGFAAGETKVFLVDNSDGYGIDACLAAGASCGAAMAGAWCRTHDFARATEFGKVVVTPTLVASIGTVAYEPSSDAKVAITCER